MKTARFTSLTAFLVVAVVGLQCHSSAVDAQTALDDLSGSLENGGGSATLRVDPSAQTVTVGVAFTVDILVEDAESLAGYECCLAVDPDVGDPEEASDGGFLGTTGNAVVPFSELAADGPGTVCFGAISIGGFDEPSGSGTLATVALRAVSEGTSSLTLYDVVLSQPGGVEQNVSAIEDGEVVVESAPHRVLLPSVIRRHRP